MRRQINSNRTGSQFTLSQSVGQEGKEEDVTPDQSAIFDPQAIIDMAFDPKASLQPNQSIYAPSGRPRKPHCTTPSVRCSSSSRGLK